MALPRSMLFALTLLGCSQGGGSAFTVTHVTIEAGWSPVCPEQPPPADASCFDPGALVQCEYGDNPWSAACDPVFTCSNETWAQMMTTCPPAPGPNPASCPSSLASIAPGSRCTVQEVCHNDRGVYCDCTIPDGGTASTWLCEPGPGCPVPRPRIGSPCEGGANCGYDNSEGYWEGCNGTIWTLSGPIGF